MKLKKFLAALFIASTATVSHAIIIDNDTFTTDTTTGLDFLDLSLVTHNTRNYFETNGYSYGGRSWSIATTGQLAHLFAEITGAEINGGDITGFQLFNQGGARSILDLMIGSGETAFAWVDGGFQGVLGSIINATSDVDGTSHDLTKTAWLVSATALPQTPSPVILDPQPAAEVPEPSPLPLLGLGIIGLGFVRRRRV